MRRPGREPPRDQATYGQSRAASPGPAAYFFADSLQAASFEALNGRLASPKAVSLPTWRASSRQPEGSVVLSMGALATQVSPWQSKMAPPATGCDGAETGLA